MSVEDLNDFIVTLQKSGMSPNTVLPNVIIIAQFCKGNGRSGITRQVQYCPNESHRFRANTAQEELVKLPESNATRRRPQPKVEQRPKKRRPRKAYAPAILRVPVARFLVTQRMELKLANFLGA